MTPANERSVPCTSGWRRRAIFHRASHPAALKLWHTPPFTDAMSVVQPAAVKTLYGAAISSSHAPVGWSPIMSADVVMIRVFPILKVGFAYLY
eukprot:1187822-Prorocentrum_minimum.AAC.5